MTDEHNIKTLGCYRDRMEDTHAFPWGDGVKVDTPHIDSLAADGALFTNFNTIAPLCTPSRASFMTGLYPAFTGAKDNHGTMNQDAVTFAELLQKEKGYYTGYIGKWHLNGRISPGFNDKNRPFGFNHTRYQFNRGHYKYFEEENGEVHVQESMDNITGNLEVGYGTDFLFKKATNFISKQLEEDRHFALMLSIPDPHGPNVVRPPYDTMFNTMKFNMPASGVAAFNKSPATPGFATIRQNLQIANETIAALENSEEWQTNLRNYFGMVKLIDDKLGDLLSLLKKSGQEENTIVVFTSDHGDMMGEHGHYNKGKPYKSSAGVPFIIRYPKKIQKRKVVRTAYSSPDFAPTILSLMGIDHTGANFQGVDGSKELKSKMSWTNNVQIRYITDSKRATWAAAVDRQYKLILARNGPPFLFDLQKDPDEIYNVYADENYKIIGQTLKTALLTAMKDYKFPLMSQRSIYLDKPVCLDTSDQIPNHPYRVCNDFRKLRYIKKCKLSEVNSICPDACGLCCDDSPGQILHKQELINCNDVKAKTWKEKKELCNFSQIHKLCPVTCSKCIPFPSSSPSFTPSISLLPSSAPSIGPSTSSSPSSAPSTGPSTSSSPSSAPSTGPSTSSSPSSVLSTSPSMSSSPSSAPSTSSRPSSAPSTSSRPSSAPSTVPSTTTSPSSAQSSIPSSRPSSTPSTSSRPSSAPSKGPSTTGCNPSLIPSVDNVTVTIKGKNRTCTWIKKAKDRMKFCDIARISKTCPYTCGCNPSLIPSVVPSTSPSRSNCVDNVTVTVKGTNRPCTWIKEGKAKGRMKFCDIARVSKACPYTCGTCRMDDT